jgi:hypothetical protein
MKRQNTNCVFRCDSNLKVQMSKMAEKNKICLSTFIRSACAFALSIAETNSNGSLKDVVGDVKGENITTKSSRS